MLGVYLRDRIRNEEIRGRTRVTDIAKRICSLKPRTGNRSVGRPPTRWTDDLVKVAGSRWVHAASNQSDWRSMSNSGRPMADMMMMMGSYERVPSSPQPSVDRLSVTWADPSMASTAVNLFHLPTEIPVSNEVKFSPAAAMSAWRPPRTSESSGASNRPSHANTRLQPSDKTTLASRCSPTRF
ncbi:hypothetical protein MSG28_001247 [Choristoneura fumiferana]|uniref:Uncharacterized protein n=1 Tax=Choristoneura fumiferana TaxID=7141 RepID=A0ACC0K457_CHOFU|nr:hypothetical protein MSG28_001247 [Choristoneura fumiferana]